MSAVKPVNDYGLDAELARKANEKFDQGFQDECQAWIENVTNITFDKPFGEMLRDGVVLCELVNAIMPGKIKKINRTGNVWQKQENITAFLRAAREVGVAEASLFAANTLSQLTDINQVLICISAFSTAIQRNPNVNFSGPVLGRKIKQQTLDRKSTNGKKWEIGKGGGVSLLNQGSAGIMEKTGYTNAREMIKSQRLDGGKGNHVSKLNMGSAGIMEAGKYVDPREMIKRNQLEGGKGGEVSKLNQGSAGIMEAGKYVDPREMIKRNQLEGGKGGDVSMLNQGSAGIMEQSKHVDAREMIKRKEL